jgi:prophage regulatory protein
MNVNTATPENCPHCGQKQFIDERAKILASLPERGYIRQKLLIPHLVPFSVATLWRRVKSGDFPPPVRLSPRITAWRIEDIKAWLNSNPDPKRRARK